MALFEVNRAQVTSATVPTSVVFYGSNSAGFLNSDGVVVTSGDVESPESGTSLEIDEDGWSIQSSPTPGSCALAP
jgi:hypothetical protein